MPPKQCPGCGRFLKNAFVDGLRHAPAACPACGDTLTPASFAVPIPAGGAGDEPPGAADDPTDDPTSEASVRPPDLSPETVRDRSDDVLAGWDLGASEAEIAAWRHDERPFPTDTVVVAGAGVVGLVLGACIDGDRRGRGAALGAVAGLVGAAVARRIWRLQP